ncbi:FimV/HubP family polar landmark protein [Pusillimonas sp.]|uniref:type IV pilus assembly protein FimV n=1 Tax=Pusillimonas sp. TaxID=3040095 RepID=UPI0029A5E425|nr:FimV/HubP family polar landmark protein [Pusillimonas sp.]MDX3893363.1 FimV/HubP family polar landmark protein [Pusillimonas sp.]
MRKTCCGAGKTPLIQATPVALALAAILAAWTPAHAASIGHSRMVSAPGQPLHINVPLRELSQADLQSLRVSAAPAAAWQQVGLVPPVELSSLRFTVDKGFAPDSRVVQIRSSQPFDGPVADLLLQIDTAGGRQQHQVSLLTHSSRPGPAAAAQTAPAGSGAAASGAAAGSAPAASGSISVRRGDTLFALARANAVEGVSVYQMMIALQKANPQAFIDGNINLVKAGATLAIPDSSALRAVSDREARRIFQQHAQAYANYRQAVAARRGEAVQGGSAQQGAVSGASARVTASPAAAAGDQVVLSSGSASDAAQDEQDATRRNIDESQARVSQLERNVQSLNQALQMQGEAAKEAVLDGAAVVGQTLSDAATSIGASSEAPASSESAASSPGQPAAPGGASGTAAAEGAGGNASEQAAPAQNGAAAAGETGVAPSGAATAAGGQQGAEGRGAESVAQADAGPASAQDDSNPSTSSKAEQPVSWLQENLLGVITAVLALVVLIIAWVLRRASAARSDDGQGGVTEAMVQERLEKIDLDFDKPPTDGRPPHTA